MRVDSALCLAVITMALSACQADIKQAVARCETEALKLYPNDRPFATSPQFDSYMTACTGAARYEATVACPRGFNERSVDAACYEPTDLVSQWLVRLERAIAK